MTGNLDYNAQDVARYFDELGRGEWDRLETSLIGRISFRIHRKFLLAQISPGMRVLDAGCGPGRFAIEMLRAGARVTLVDISTTQLDLARENISDAQLLDRVDGLHQLDVCDLSDLEGRFDAVV